MTPSCRKCGSSKSARERRPNGYTECLDCGFKVSSKEWDDTRWCFVEDDDCHWYLIPVYEKRSFEDLMNIICSAHYYNLLDRFDDRYGKFRHDGPHVLSFIDPRDDA